MGKRSLILMFIILSLVCIGGVRALDCSQYNNNETNCKAASEMDFTTRRGTISYDSCTEFACEYFNYKNPVCKPRPVITYNANLSCDGATKKYNCTSTLTGNSVKYLEDCDNGKECKSTTQAWRTVLQCVIPQSIVDCNNGGGIYCEGGVCAKYGTSNQISCNISVNQFVIVPQGSKFLFSELLVKKNIILKFRSTQELSSPVTSLNGNSGGAGGSSNGCNDDKGSGGSGDSGGATGKKGKPGGVSDDGYNFIAQPSPYIGAKVFLFGINSINVSGKIDVNGEGGAGGADATGQYSCGYAGEGGAGGSGAGELYLISTNLYGTGSLSANGGPGGFGGRPTDDGGCFPCTTDGECTCDDCGGGAGGGGGAGAGSIFISVTNDLSSLSKTCNGGEGGSLSYTCDNGQNGNSGGTGGSNPDCGTVMTVTISEVKDIMTDADTYPDACNNDFDDNYARGIDFNDSDCQNACSGWKKSIFDIFKEGYFLNGYDGCCGDDVLNGDFEILEDTKIKVWIESTGTTISQSKTNVITGQYSLLAISTDDNKEWQSVNSDVFIPIEPNTNYVLSGDIYLPQNLPLNSWVSLIAHGYDATKTGTLKLNKESTQITNAGKYHISLELTSDELSSTKYINVILGIYNLPDKNSVYFDNIHFEKVNSVFPTLEDYGFINSNGYGYLCYNYNAADLTQSTTTSAWTWLDAGKDPFKIITIGTPDGTTDVISNSANWSYCDATGNGQLNGLPIDEYGTFKPTYTSLTGMECSEFLSLMTGANYGVCDVGEFTNCCEDEYVNFENPLSFKNCECYGDGGVTIDFCDSEVIPQLEEICHEEENINLYGESGLIEKSLCNFDLTGCLFPNYYNPDLSCEMQDLPAGYTQDLCIPHQTYCKDGTYITTTETTANADKQCCVGVGASCISLPDITINTCNAPYELYGADEEGVFCQDYVSIQGTSQRCCLNGLIRNDIFNTNFLGAISNESFVCFRQEENNLIGDCCFGSECANMYFLNPNNNRIDFAKRLYSTGHALQSISTYDEYDQERDMFVDYVSKDIVTSNGFAPITIRKSLSMSGFSYLEFDVAYNSENIQNIFINDVDYSLLSNFLNNGKEAMRWHHAIIPLKNTQKEEELRKLYIYANEGTVILVDNIILTPSTDADLEVNSKNYYCTGGFGTWISDLDPNWTKYTSSDDFWSDWKSYGQYKFACEAQGSYGWTGHQCCGDDTKLDNYGEIFNDTQAGCFNGTYMMNNWTIWDAKNIADWKTEFNDYYYNDLLYFNNQFIGCQVQEGKYDSLKTSIDGNNLGNTNLVNPNAIENEQCKQMGRYYCMNNAWHKEIVGYDEAITSDIVVSIKHSPPGSEIIINGNFGGDAPEPECTHPRCEAIKD